MEILEKVTAVAIENHDMTQTYEKVFPVVAQLVHTMGGSFEDAKDIFHDALVIFMEKTSQFPVPDIRSEKAYITGIAKHLWLRKHQQDRCRISLSDMEKDITIPEDYFPTVDDKRLLHFLKLVGKKCMDLLRAFYFRRLPLKKMVNELGYSNEHSASVQKYKCLEKVRNVVKEKSLTYEHFTK
jgi:DNA-directed RNA polymerase specialized sigma24 family protein